jgi:hypothetical protein
MNSRSDIKNAAGCYPTQQYSGLSRQGASLSSVRSLIVLLLRDFLEEPGGAEKVETPRKPNQVHPITSFRVRHGDECYSVKWGSGSRKGANSSKA